MSGKQYACPYLQRALEHASGLTISEFIQISGFPIDNFMVDNFFDNLNDNVPIYVTNELIEWCGFGSKSFIHKKRDFNLILKNFEKNTDYWAYSNKEYAKYYETHEYTKFPHPASFRGENKTKHLILTVDCFKELIMMLNTPRSPTIRKHYIQIERLIHIYMRYQCACMNLSYTAEIDQLKRLSHVEQYSRLQRINELERTLYERWRVGVIYFITDGVYTKIGYTFNLPQRLAVLQTANPKQLVVANYYYAQFPHVEEQRLHLEHSDALVRGEWFRLKDVKN